MWNLMRLGMIKDGHEGSWAHTLAIPALILMTLRYLLGGFTLVLFGQAVVFPVWTAAEYTLSAGMWLAYLAQNKVVEHKYKNGNGASNGSNTAVDSPKP